MKSTRRTFLATSSAASIGGLVSTHAQQATEYALEPLPYSLNSLEPHVDAKTMEIHHGKHHAAYVINLNKALGELKPTTLPTLEALQLIPGSTAGTPALRTTIRNNGGGHFNHTLFWASMAAPGSPGVGKPGEKLAAAITKAFGSVEKFQEIFGEAALKQFGSGWAWLIQKADGSLGVTATANQDNPLMKGVVPEADLGTPILGLDVWEHAYYLHYQNRRIDYIKAWWNIVNWQAVADRWKA
jgi:Fe-Mn family superoxide dismutase